MSARAVVARALAADEVSTGAAFHVLSVGKAASAMAEALVSSVDAAPRSGLVIGTHGGAPAGLAWVESAHPVPDERSQQAARAALALAGRVAPDETLVVLVSGGASALMALPAPGLALADKQAVVARLLAHGADIWSLNCVRKHLSSVKGGRLAEACRGRVRAWLLSDVVGDDPSVIGSGPTVADPTTFAEALEVLDRLGGRGAYPRSAVAHLVAGVAGTVDETPKPGRALAHVSTRVIGSAALAVEGAAAAAHALGYEVVVRPAPVVGEAREAARAHLAWAREAAGGLARRPVCLLSCGETTVAVRGDGRGGRNQEFALASALALGPDEPFVVASVGTDGVDGPTGAAGAWVDRDTVPRGLSHGVDAIAYLEANDSWSYFHAAGGHVITGPTDTNVGDLQVVLMPAAR